MDTKSLLQKALGPQWELLPQALKAHYQAGDNVDVGWLDIDYPPYLQPYFSLLHLLGALVDRRGRQVPTRVEKHQCGASLHWRRSLCFASGRGVSFNSLWCLEQNRELTEYVNPFMGLRMVPRVEHGVLYYSGRCLLLRLGRYSLSLPEWLFLGHASIMERALGEREFEMDFQLTHPWFGRIYRYRGRFTTQPHSGTDAACPD